MAKIKNLNVGDTVKVKDFKKLAVKYGVDKYGDVEHNNTTLVTTMEKWCGINAIITYVDTNWEQVSLKFEGEEEESIYAWPDWILKKIKEEAI